MVEPPRLMIALASCVAMISRRRRCAGDRIGEALAHLGGEIALQLLAEIGIVRHRALEQRVVQGELGVGQQHRELGPRQRLAAAGALGERCCRRADTPPRG